MLIEFFFQLLMVSLIFSTIYFGYKYFSLKNHIINFNPFSSTKDKSDYFSRNMPRKISDIDFNDIKTYPRFSVWNYVVGENEPHVIFDSSDISVIQENFNFVNLISIKSNRHLKIKGQFYDITNIQVDLLDIFDDYNINPISKTLPQAFEGRKIPYNIQIIIETKDSNVSFFESAKSKIMVDDFDGAFLELTKAIEINPTDYVCYYLRGRISYDLGSYKNAINDFSIVIELITNILETFKIRGKYNKFEELDCESYIIKTYLLRGDSNLELKNYEIAIADFSIVIELKSEDSDPYFKRGMCYFELGNLHDALEDFSKVIELLPNDESSYYNRHVIREKLGDLDGAKKDLLIYERLKSTRTK